MSMQMHESANKIPGNKILKHHLLPPNFLIFHKGCGVQKVLRWRGKAEVVRMGETMLLCFKGDQGEKKFSYRFWKGIEAAKLYEHLTTGRSHRYMVALAC